MSGRASPEPPNTDSKSPKRNTAKEPTPIYADYLDARDAPYNLVSSTTADQTTQLQAFINDCAQTKLPGHIPFEGTILTNTIYWPSEDVTLIGPEGWQPPLVIQNLSTDANLFQHTKHDVQFRGHLIKNLKFKAATGTVSQGAMGFYVDTTVLNFEPDNVVFENVAFEGFATGLYMLDGFWCSLRRCRFEDNKDCGFFGWRDVSNTYENVEIGNVPENAVGGWVLGRNFLVLNSGTAAENSGGGSILWKVGYFTTDTDPLTGNAFTNSRVSEGHFDACHFEGAKEYFVDVRSGSTVHMTHPHFITSGDESNNNLPAAVHFEYLDRIAVIDLPNFQGKTAAQSGNNHYFEEYILVDSVQSDRGCVVIQPWNRQGAGGTDKDGNVKDILDHVDGVDITQGTLQILSNPRLVGKDHLGGTPVVISNEVGFKANIARGTATDVFTITLSDATIEQYRWHAFELQLFAVDDTNSTSNFGYSGHLARYYVLITDYQGTLRAFSERMDALDLGVSTAFTAPGPIDLTHSVSGDTATFKVEWDGTGSNPTAFARIGLAWRIDGAGANPIRHAIA